MEGQIYQNDNKKDKRPYLVVFLIQSLFSGMVLIQKAVFDSGMNNFIFVFYRQVAATVFLAPIAFYFEWITMSLDIYGVALIFTSATLASATTNCLPAITFFLAILFRLETWKIKTPPGLAKLVGIMTSIAGALVLALYKGLVINPHFHHQIHGFHPHGHVWIKGVFLMLTSNTLFATWLVFQGPIMKSFPSKLLYLALGSFLSMIQSFVVAIAIERDPSQWKLGWNLRLVSVTYCGMVVTGVAYYLQSYVIEKRGPVFLTMWTPLGFGITTFFSSLFLGEDITLGSILGGTLLVGGLYSVLWAKTKEGRKSILPEANVVKEDQAMKAVALEENDDNRSLNLSI